MKPILLFLLTCAMWGQGKPAKAHPKCDTCSVKRGNPYLVSGVSKEVCVASGYFWADLTHRCWESADAYATFDDAAPKPAVSSDKHDEQCGKPNSPIECLNGLTSDGRNPDMAQEIPYSNWKTDPQRKLNSPPTSKPSFTVEKAVEVKSAPPDVECWYSSNGRPIPGKTMCNDLIPVPQYSCPKRSGYSTFLLPDESTGEKVCLNVLKEKP